MIAFIAGVLGGWWVNPKPKMMYENRSDIMKLIRRLEGHIAESAEPRQEQEELHTLADTQPIKVRYTAEEIMPKRCNPKENGLYWVIINNSIASKYWWEERNTSISPILWRGIDWLIDIPGAPEELKPLKYPENRPQETGRYLFHRTADDKWLNWWVDKNNPDFYGRLADWFINYRLSSQKGEK